jgi:hypothetical protein
VKWNLIRGTRAALLPSRSMAGRFPGLIACLRMRIRIVWGSCELCIAGSLLLGVLFGIGEMWIPHVDRAVLVWFLTPYCYASLVNAQH